MISYTNVRHNGCTHTTTREQTLADALDSLINFELGYGGRVIEASPTKVVVRTKVLSAVDTVTFEGAEDEMLPLLKAAAIHLELLDTNNLPNLIWPLIPKEPDGGANPLLVTTMGLVLGGQLLIQAIIPLLGDQDPGDPVFASQTPGDLLSAYLLQRETGISMKEVLAC